MKKIFLPSSLILLIAFASEGCKKDPLNNLTNDETRIYITNYDTTASFSNYNTFSIVDSVDIIQDNQLLGKQLGLFESSVIRTIQLNMKQSGYTMVNKTGNPDLAINISEITNTSTGVFSYTDYWNSYDSFYDPYYWGDPGYGYYSPYAVGTYTIQTGGLEIDLLDLKNATANGNKIVTIWTGLARGEQVFDPSNASTEVSALFAQSAYLKN